VLNDEDCIQIIKKRNQVRVRVRLRGLVRVRVRTASKSS